MNFRKNIDDFEIVVGTNKWKSGGTHYKAEKLIPHENYDIPKKSFDIGLIRVQTPIVFTEKVQPIKISEKMVKEGNANLQATGWGRTSVSILFFLSLAQQKYRAERKGRKTYQKIKITSIIHRQMDQFQII